MNFRSPIVKIISIATVLISNELFITKATAQTLNKFSAVYDTTVIIDPTFRPDLGISRVTVTGEIPQVNDAPFGLTNFVSNTFGQLVEINPLPDGTIESAEFVFEADPTLFGLSPDLREQPFSDRYFGTETDNELFGNASDMAVFNFVEGTVMGGGNINIIGGNGIFDNATGSIIFEQNDRLGEIEDPTNPFASLTEPFAGQATLTFSVNVAESVPESVPEPKSIITLISMGIIGVTWGQGKKVHK